MADTFQRGDVVILKSGSQKLTVINVAKDPATGGDICEVAWHDPPKSFREKYPAEALERLEE